MSALNGVKITGTIVPTDTTDLYPTHDSQYGKGGYMSVADQTSRDSISSLRRTEGMLVWVNADSTFYRLSGGISNSNWVESSITGPQGPGFNAVSNPGSNRVLISDGTTTGASAQSNLTFNGSTFSITGGLNISGVTSSILLSDITGNVGPSIITQLGLTGVGIGQSIIDARLSVKALTSGTSSYVFQLRNSNNLSLLSVRDDGRVDFPANATTYLNNTISLGATISIPGFTGSTRLLTVDTNGIVGATADSDVKTIFKSWDGQGSYITNGNARYHVMSETGTITGWSILAIGTTASCMIDVWKLGYTTSLPTSSNSIVSSYPSLTTGNVIRTTSVVGWTSSMLAGDILGFNIVAATNSTVINFTLEYMTS